MTAGIIAIVGLIVYLIGSRVDERVEEIGRICFAMGVLAWLLGH
jgi:hypothetical protein